MSLGKTPPVAGPQTVAEVVGILQAQLPPILITPGRFSIHTF